MNSDGAVRWLLVDDWARRDGLADRWAVAIDAKDDRLLHDDPPALTSEEAVNRVRLKHIDVMLIDLEIPPDARTDEHRRFGVACAEKVREVSPTTEILAVSMLPPDPDDPSDREYVSRLSRIGVKGWLSKTRTTYAQFADAILTAHNGLQAFRPLTLANDWRLCLAYPHKCAEMLNPREHQAMCLAATGLDNEQIASQMVIARSTVREYLNDSWLKLGCAGRSGLVLWAIKNCPNCTPDASIT